MLKIAFSPNYAHPLPEGHRFPMEKYELLPEQLLYEGTVKEDSFFVPDDFGEEWIIYSHEVAYYEKLKNLSLSKSEIRKTGFPLSHALVQREVQIMNGSIQACLFAIDHGISMNIAGGTHHAFSDRGEGFCLLNDIAVSANYLIANQYADRVLVVDLDVHQGNGTAQMLKNEPKAFTMSMHGQANYPLHKEVSDLDIGLADGTSDEEYLEILEKHFYPILDAFQPDFIIYQCGVDVLKSDKLGRLGMSIAGCKMRDQIVLQAAKVNMVPIMCCMGGGYSPRIADIIEAHANTYRLAQDLFF
ncbi:histone deacetylase [Belliella sp. DSM 111904]|uniref:Histone deacetylase n=1 Tax=Belliella filtrata TaxID=2923435 RepID=A0ABS9V4M9_9BACT|nr:histone deacetylase [Belliella filtrata]MCH7411343.1 histone deacetylase [Belliella filtrata]